jgi:hypothetical protein
MGQSQPAKTLNKGEIMSTTEARVALQKAPLTIPSDIDPKAVKDITGALNALLAEEVGVFVSNSVSKSGV